MQHDPTKNVLWVRALPEEVASRLGLDQGKALDLLAAAKTKLYAARLQRPTPFVDKTVYVSWNAMCVSAYLQAAQALGLDDARKFALRSLDRILAEAWHDERGLAHVIAYADPTAEKRFVRGLLDDYAFTVLGLSGRVRSDRRDQLLQFRESHRRRNDPPLWRCRRWRLLRHRSIAGREAATGRTVGTAQAVPGRANACGQSRCRDRAAASTCVYQRSQLSRKGVEKPIDFARELEQPEMIAGGCGRRTIAPARRAATSGPGRSRWETSPTRSLSIALHPKTSVQKASTSSRNRW